MALRKRIEKLEGTRPMAAADLIELLDRRVWGQLSSHERTLVAEVHSRSGRRSPSNTDGHAAAMDRYQDALGRAITELSDEDLETICIHGCVSA